jgi:hypothetical protein
MISVSWIVEERTAEGAWARIPGSPSGHETEAQAKQVVDVLVLRGHDPTRLRCRASILTEEEHADREAALERLDLDELF